MSRPGKHHRAAWKNALAVFATVLVSSILVGGCASVPMTSQSLDAEAKRFTPDPDKASIYVYRGGGLGTAVLFDVILDGRIAGSLAPYTYMLLSVSPGQHTLAVHTQESTQQQKVPTEAGKTYFFQTSVEMGWVSPRALLQPVTEEVGRKGVMASKRAETASYD